MPLKKETKAKPYIPVSARPFEEHPGVTRPQGDSIFDVKNRSKFLVGGQRYGFGWRRRFLNDHIKKQCDSKSRYQTGNRVIDALERAPQPNEKMVNLTPL